MKKTILVLIGAMTFASTAMANHKLNGQSPRAAYIQAIDEIAGSATSYDARIAKLDDLQVQLNKLNKGDSSAKSDISNRISSLRAQLASMKEQSAAKPMEISNELKNLSWGGAAGI
jgi:hypothetical protein